jgi:hypothetical protein
MKVRRQLSWAVCLSAAVVIGTADEGKWTPEQLSLLDAKWLKQQGLELPVSRLWDPQSGTGLLAATINIGNCSGAFVTPTGLFLTNHHCLFSIIQEYSTPGRDLITNGFLAHDPAGELRGKTARVTVPHKMTDVTREIESGGAARRKELVAACEKTPGMRCSIAAFDGGLQYVLVETMELTDVRLVYAPPRSIGEFGGDIDNFQWPRHKGDFALGRIYKDGKPYQPEFYFHISRAGVKPGDFVMVAGYPFRTVRSLTAEEMAIERDFRFQYRGEIYREWIRKIEETTKGNAAGEIAMAATLRSLLNLRTNGDGMADGLARGRIIENKRTQDEAVLQWAAEHAAYSGSKKAKAELDRLVLERRRTGNRDALLALVKPGAMALRQATTLVRLATERAKPEEQRDAEYLAREWPGLRNALERDQKSFYRAADEALLQVWLDFAGRLNENQRIKALDGATPTAASLYAATKVTDLGERLKMFEESTEQLHARKDPLLELAFALEPELRAWQAATQGYDAALARLRPQWMRAVAARAGKPVAPDANNTLRINLAHVKGYSPRPGVVQPAETTLAGMLAKHTGKPPFDLPQSLLDAAKTVRPEQIPLDFLADADTTGGSSGSPVLNGRGELVGLNFDRPWENVAGDFGYDPEVSRNISVDIRFFLWMLQDVEHADALLKELCGSATSASPQLR